MKRFIFSLLIIASSALQIKALHVSRRETNEFNVEEVLRNVEERRESNRADRRNQIDISCNDEIKTIKKAGNFVSGLVFGVGAAASTCYAYGSYLGFKLGLDPATKSVTSGLALATGTLLLYFSGKTMYNTYRILKQIPAVLTAKEQEAKDKAEMLKSL